MLNATVAIKRDVVADELVILGVKPDHAIPDFIPGQYVTLGLPPESPRLAGTGPEIDPPHVFRSGYIERAYSIGSPPSEKRFIEFYLAVVPDGALTARLAALAVGDRLYIGHKYVGAFTLKEIPAQKDLVMIATGTGIAPFMSMLRTESTWTSTGTAERKIVLIHGVRFAADFAYSEELKAFEAQRMCFRYIPIASREPLGTQYTGARGRVQKLFADGTVTLNPEKQHIMMCGNPAMIEENEKLFLSLGFVEHSRKTPGNLHVEKYW